MKKTLAAVILCVPVTLLTGCVYETAGYSDSEYVYSGTTNLYSAGYGYGFSDYGVGGPEVAGYNGNYYRGWYGAGWRGDLARWPAAGWRGSAAWHRGGWRR